MIKLWVVMAYFEADNIWDICDFADKPYTSTNFFIAHRFKREIQEDLQKTGYKHWTKNKFKIVRFIIQEED
jgi:hypothetical protein